MKEALQSPHGTSAKTALPYLMDCVETLQKKIEEVRVAQRVVAEYTQEQAFDNQCTGVNPGYPLLSEIKQMYLNAYYGQ